jgi:hypothetical protein
MSKPIPNVQLGEHALRTFLINQFFRINQKKKIALEIVAKIASV